MKKRVILMTSLLCVAGMLTGCSGGTYSEYVKLADYKGLELNKIKPEVTEESLEYEIEMILEENAEYNPVERAAEMGDNVNCDFEGTVDGEAFEGGSAEDFEVLIGEGFMLEEFENGLIGMKAGDTKEVTLTFPDDYDEGELSGKEAVFSITVNEVSETSIPELTDEFVATISDAATVDEYKEQLRAELLSYSEENSAYSLSADALQAVIDGATFEGYPQELYDSCKAEYDAMNASFAEMFGMDVADFELSEEDTKAAVMEMVNETMVVTTIAEKEKIEVTEEEYTDYVNNAYAEEEFESVEEYEATYPKEESMKMLLTEKVKNFLIENAKITEISEEEYYAEDESFYEETEE